MAGEPYITVIGNLADDPSLRFTASGHAVASFTIAQTPRSFNRETNQWVDDETLWVRCSVWREEAENVSETLQKWYAGYRSWIPQGPVVRDERRPAAN